MYPATTRFPLVLVQLENEMVTLFLSSFSFVDSRLRHLLGVVLEKPKRMGIEIMD